ncbi:MAG: NADH-quinone oxidoreductase subunit H [Fusobacteria bacterium]|nr:NADH-quinone oxidoreductase subunit H [Fusobacteriota bacterium]
MEIIFNILSIIFIPLIIIGVIEKIKSLLCGRIGNPWYQFLLEFIKLMRKELIVSKRSSFITKIAPFSLFLSVIIATLFVPLINGHPLMSFSYDFVVFAYFLGFSKLLTLLLAMDSGSSFEGMGASREVKFSLLMEASLFLLFASLILVSGQTKLNLMVQLYLIKSPQTIVFALLLIIIFFIFMLLESSRMPIDDPNTHLELTMIHEVMVLDLSCTHLAMMSYANSLKLYIFMSLIINTIIPVSHSLFLALLLNLVALGVLCCIIAVIETLYARIRFTRLSEIMLLTLIGAFILLTLILYMNGVHP